MTEENSTEEPVSSTNAEPRHRSTKRLHKGIPRLIPWLALVLAAVAMTGLGIDFIRDIDIQSAAEDQTGEVFLLGARAEKSEKAIALIEENVSVITRQQAGQNTTITQIQQRLESLPNRLSAVETTLSSLQGISSGARDAWLISEAEYYMQLANTQLQLANNPDLAILALTHADDRLIQLSDARLTRVRATLSDELRALETMEKPDISGIVLTLASLAGVVESLPLANKLIMEEQSLSDERTLELTGVDRAWKSVTTALKGLVKIRDASEEGHPMIAPREEYFLRANVSLQLQVARLALLRGDEAVFHQSLDDADNWITEYYAKDNAGVISARKTISSIRSGTITVPMPDISRSIFMLRQFKEIASTGTAGAIKER